MADYVWIGTNARKHDASKFTVVLVGTRYLPGSVSGTEYHVPGTVFIPEPGPGAQEVIPWYLVPGTWYLVLPVQQTGS